MPKLLPRVLFLLAIAFCICRAERLSTGEDVKSYVSRMIDENEVVVFSKSNCSHCKSTRSLLKTMKATIDFEVSIADLDLMREEDGPLVQMELMLRTGQKTVPNVFIGSKQVGGNSELQKLVVTGRLQEILTDLIKSRSSVIRANYLRGKIAGNEPSDIL